MILWAHLDALIPLGPSLRLSLPPGTSIRLTLLLWTFLEISLSLWTSHGAKLMPKDVSSGKPKPLNVIRKEVKPMNVSRKVTLILWTFLRVSPPRIRPKTAFFIFPGFNQRFSDKRCTEKSGRTRSPLLRKTPYAQTRLRAPNRQRLGVEPLRMLPKLIKRTNPGARLEVRQGIRWSLRKSTRWGAAQGRLPCLLLLIWVLMITMEQDQGE